MFRMRRVKVILNTVLALMFLTLFACQSRGPISTEQARVESPVAQIIERTVVVEVEVTRIVKETVIVPKEHTLIVTQVVTQAPSPQPVISAVGMVETGEWLIEIAEVRSDLGMDPSRRSLALLVWVTNQGMQTSTFVGSQIKLMDSHGRTYEFDFGMTLSAPRRYGTDRATRVNPGARVYTVMVFDVPTSEKSFVVIPGSVDGWSGDISFTLD